MSTMHTNAQTGADARQVVQRMGEAASNWLASLTPDLRAKGQLDFANHEERTCWHYTPIERRGLPYGEMDRKQQRLAQALIASGLSRAGWVTASTIMGLEITLDVIEGWSRPLWWRDSELYHVTVFGEPHEQKPWGWRYEGHHISLNYTIVGGQIVTPTPTFFGSNPADSPLIGGHSLRPLAGIEDLARELMHALSVEQQAQALLTPVAPPDLVMLNRPYVVENALSAQTPGVSDPPAVAAQFPSLTNFAQERGVTQTDLEAVRYTATPKGLATANMNAGQRELLLALIGDYIHRMPDELAEIEMNKLHQLGVDHIHFAWAGGLERRQPHYYRLQGPRFLVEYDNTQNNANHIHSVWRDPEDDFGKELLARHYAASHHH